MNAHFKARTDFLAAIRTDLARRHPFAHERLGFIFAGLSRIGAGTLTILAQTYEPVDDGDYLHDHSVGAMMGPDAIRKALQRAYQTRTAAIHVHMHGHSGCPEFSGVDLRENAKFVPNFFNIAPQAAHGAIVLSNDGVVGQLWLQRSAGPIAIDRFTAVGAPCGLQGAFQ